MGSTPICDGMVLALADVREQPTQEKVRQALEEMLQEKFSGFDASGGLEDQILQYYQIKSERYKKSVIGGLSNFIKGNDYTFIIDVLKPLSKKQRRRVLKKVLASHLDTSAVCLSMRELAHTESCDCFALVQLQGHCMHCPAVKEKANLHLYCTGSRCDTQVNTTPITILIVIDKAQTSSPSDALTQGAQRMSTNQPTARIS
jgi:hypothetical protein